MVDPPFIKAPHFIEEFDTLILKMRAMAKTYFDEPDACDSNLNWHWINRQISESWRKGRRIGLAIGFGFGISVAGSLFSLWETWIR